MEWWGKMIVPIKEAWIKVAKRIRIRKTGLVKLRHDVRTCEYEDVRILWEMLKKKDRPLQTSTEGNTKTRFSRVVEWARRAPLLCHHGHIATSRGRPQAQINVLKSCLGECEQYLNNLHQLLTITNTRRRLFVV